MAFETVNGFNPLGGSAPAVNDAGLFPIAGSPTGEQWDNTHKDLLQALLYGTLAGVLLGGVCTAALLVVTIPANTYYVAGSIVWFNGTAYTQSVAANCWIWGCADGVIRVTLTSAQDPDFLGNRSCLLTQVTVSGGVATVDNSVQQRARTADNTNRIVGENAKVFAPVLHTVPAGFVGVIESGSQYTAWDKLTNSGKIICRGKLRIQA